ncbi:MAG: hypothetical protein QOK42_219 [Frankiaceae bacterium]|jgi:prolyl-tRNA editing enzyme YbaK/EbsC (Cys-tRNA(Pro) deacylase)|nr:hypothetical protein [Frankiaceae bacterium]
MTEPLHRNALRVQQALQAVGSPGRVRRLDASAGTAAEAAAALGVTVGAIAKSLVFQADEQPVLVVMSGSDRLDTKRLAEAVGAARVRRPDADAVRAATGYPIGGVSPAGLPEGLQVLVDRGLAAFDVVWASAGTPHDVFPTSFDELLAITGGEPTDVREG